MSDIDIAIQDGIEAQLRADPDVAAVFAEFGVNSAKIYTMSGPIDGEMLYIVIGDDQILGEDTECTEASEVSADLHIYARRDTPANSRKAAKRLAGVARRSILRKLVLAGHTVDDWTHEGTRHLRDPDALTAHSVVTVTYLTTADA